MKSKIPWDDIKKEYTIGIEQDGKKVYPTLRELAAKYQIDLSGLSHRSKKEDWLSERQIISNKIHQRIQQKTIEQISDKGVDFDLKCFEDAQELRRKQRELLDSIEPGDPYAIKKLCAIGQGIKIAQDLGKNALGEQPKATIEADTTQMTLDELQKKKEEILSKYIPDPKLLKQILNKENNAPDK